MNQQNNTSEKQLHDPKLMSEIIQASNEDQRKIVEKASERDGKKPRGILMIEVFVLLGIILAIIFIIKFK